MHQRAQEHENIMAAQKKKAPGKAVAKWDAKLAELAKRQKGVENSASVGGNFIQTRAASFVIDGGMVPGGKFKAIVLMGILENSFYATAFDADNPGAPECFSLGEDAHEMTPHENSADPQNEACEGCPQNEFGTAEVGRGKACANRRRLILISEKDFDNLDKAAFRMLRLPPTSGSNWKGYVDNIEAVTKNKATCAVVTEISIAPHPKKQQEITFRLVEEIENDEALGVIIEKLLPRAEKEVFQPYPKVEAAEAEPAPARGRAKPAAKAAPVKGKKAAAPAKFAKKK
jgi:hypothetical protein